MIDKRMMRSDPMDDKLTLYRQQVRAFLLKKTKTKLHSYLLKYLMLLSLAQT